MTGNHQLAKANHPTAEELHTKEVLRTAGVRAMAAAHPAATAEEVQATMEEVPAATAEVARPEVPATVAAHPEVTEDNPIEILTQRTLI